MIDSCLRFVRTSMLTRLLLVLSVAVLIASAPACDNTTSSAPTPTPLQITEKPAPAPPPPIAPVAQQPIFVVFESMSGKIRIQLHTKEAPRICANFLNLIQRGYYTRKQWDDFSPVVRQLGERVDINAIPYSLPREFAPKLLFDIGGRLCLANTTERRRAWTSLPHLLDGETAGTMEPRVCRVRHDRRWTRCGNAYEHWRACDIDRD